MDEIELKKLINPLLTDRTRFIWKTSEVDTYLKSFNFDYGESNLTKLILCFSADNIFRWLDFISSKLPEIASNSEEFVELVLQITRKVRGDMAQAPFVRSLIAVGSSDSNLGLALFKRMVILQDLEAYAGLVLGGAGQKDFAYIFGEIQSNIRSSDSATKAAYVKALRVIFEKEKDIREEDSIFGILKAAADVSEDKIVRGEAANAYIDFYKLNRKVCFEQLMSLAKQNDSEIRSMIAQRLWIADLNGGENEIEILKECSRDENPNTLSVVALALSRKGKGFPRESLDIIRDWIARGRFGEIRDIDYCLEEICKENTNTCIKVVSSWIDEENSIFGVYIPRILTDIAISDKKQLMDYLEETIAGRPKQAKIAIRTIGDLLLRNKPSEELVRRCFNVLKRSAKDKELQTELVSELVAILGQKPLFAPVQQTLDIVRDWATDPDPRVRQSILAGLGVMAESKVDYKETLSLEMSKTKGEAKIIGTKIEKTEADEGLQTYDLLRQLSQDTDPKVRKEAAIILERVNTRLSEKEDRMEARMFENKVFETLKALRPIVDVMEKPKLRRVTDYPEIDLIVQTKRGEKYLMELKSFRETPEAQKMEELIALGRSAKERDRISKLILIVNDKKPVAAWSSELSRAWDHVFDGSELEGFVNKLLRESHP